MYEEKRIGAILLMGGEGLRFGSPVPKQFLLLDGKKVFCHALETLLATHLFDEILLVCHPKWIAVAQEAETGIVRAIQGGSTRQQSSYSGLKGFQQKPDIVLIHDAVRPFVTERILQENIVEAIAHGAVDTCIPSADTLVHAPDGQTIANIPKREEFLRGQTPQTFRMDWILKAHERADIENASDDCRLILRQGWPVRVVQGEEQNLKITSEIDLCIAEQLLSLGKL